MDAPVPGPSQLRDAEIEETQIIGDAEEETLPERSQEDAAEEEEEEEEEQVAEGDPEGAQPEKKKKPRERKEQVALEREGGKSLFPFSRVQKIIKADKDLPIVAKEATYLISVCTEEFLKRFSQAIHRQAEREKRTMVQQRDIATVVRKADEFMFLEEIIGWSTLENPEKQTKRKPKVIAQRDENAEPTMLDQFVKKSGGSGETQEEASQVEGEVVMNEDGTMGSMGDES